MSPLSAGSGGRPRAPLFLGKPVPGSAGRRVDARSVLTWAYGEHGGGLPAVAARRDTARGGRPALLRAPARPGAAARGGRAAGGRQRGLLHPPGAGPGHLRLGRGAGRRGAGAAAGRGRARPPARPGPPRPPGPARRVGEAAGQAGSAAAARPDGPGAGLRPRPPDGRAGLERPRRRAARLLHQAARGAQHRPARLPRPRRPGVLPPVGGRGRRDRRLPAAGRRAAPRGPPAERPGRRTVPQE